MIQELLELVREQSHVLSEGKNVYADKMNRAEVIIKILKEGIYNAPPSSSASLNALSSGVSSFLDSISDPLRDLHNEQVKEKLEKELLDIALGKRGSESIIRRLDDLIKLFQMVG